MVFLGRFFLAAETIATIVGVHSLLIKIKLKFNEHEYSGNEEKRKKDGKK